MTDRLIEDTDDEEVVAGRKQRASLFHEAEVENFRATVKTVQGRAAIWRILEHCQLHGGSFTGDAPHTYYREGQRKIGAEIHLMFSELSDGKKLFRMMEDEAEVRQRKRDD